MADKEAQNGILNAHLVRSMRLGGVIIEDLSRALLGFIPNGLNVIYDGLLKNLPFIGHLFSHRWIEQSLKMGLGITIGQGIATDLSHYVFKPLGSFLGMIYGLTGRPLPTYSGQIGKAFYRNAGQMVGGIILGLGIISLGLEVNLLPGPLNTRYIILGIALGAFFGVFTKVIAVFSIHWVESANAATVRRNVARARELNNKLKVAARHYAKSKILMYAQDIILQMNGSSSQHHLEAFFTSDYEHFASNTHKKIDRHFDYLADRACHGDIKALRRLQALLPTKHNLQDSAFSKMIERILNERAIFKLKDDVDTFYDKWQYAQS